MSADQVREAGRREASGPGTRAVRPQDAEKAFAAAVTRRRCGLLLSYQELALAAGVGVDTIKRLESGLEVFSFRVAWALAGALGSDVVTMATEGEGPEVPR